ncbi:phage tail tape measure protein [Microvirga solisilvae]|uniref:phage tail tape measure protein n=1 Tax=Microvirga solisilvae TaxID=2919498 RepID=UPI001FAEF740|nr:phage tail tape measure protein [Microvirga solisilvae]
MARTYRVEAVISAKDAMGPGLRSAANRLRRFQQQTERANRIGSRAGSMTRGMDMSIGAGAMLGTAARFAGPAAAAAGVMMATRTSLSFERTMYDVQKATNATDDGLKGYEKTVLDLARATGKTKEEIGGMLASAGYAGRPVNELARFTEYATKATTAWNTSSEETSQSLAEIGNIYQANQQRIEEIGDAVNYVADNAAAKETDLLDFLRRSGAVGKQMGLTAEQTMAFGAAAKEIGTPTEVAATGFNALMNTMALGDGVSDNAAKGFKKLGVNSKAMQKAFVAKPLETTLSLLEKIGNVKDPLKKAEIVTDIFGKEYGDDIARMTGNLDGLRRVLGLVADKANYLGSVNKGFELITEKDFNRIDRATQALDVLATRTGNAFKLIAGNAAEEINKFVDATEKGDTSIQRLLTYYGELAGLPKGGEIDTPSQDLENWVEENFGAYSPRALFDEYFGKTGDEARQKGQQAAIAAEAASENDILARADRARTAVDEAQNRLTAVPLTPSESRRFELELSRAQDEFRVANRAADEVRTKRAALPGQVDDLQRQVISRDRLMSFGRQAPEADHQVGPGLLNFGFGPNGAGPTASPGQGGDVIAKLEGEAKIHNTVEVKLDNNLLRAEVRSIVKEEVGPIRAQSSGGVGGLNTGRSMPEAGGF